MNSFQMVCMGLSSLCVSLLFALFSGLAVPLVMLAFALASFVCLLLARASQPVSALERPGISSAHP